MGRDEFPQQKSVTSLLFSSLVKCKQKEGGGGPFFFCWLVGWLVFLVEKCERRKTKEACCLCNYMCIDPLEMMPDSPCLANIRPTDA